MKNQISQLRHAYQQLIEGKVTDQKQFAKGIISPVISALEIMEMQREAEEDRH